MNVLVTGATGFIGAALCRGLRERSCSVVEVSTRNCDLTRQGSLDQFNGTRFDRIFHLAAWTQAGDFCLHHPGEQWVINQLINTNVLAWWKACQPQAKLVCMGTSCAYDPRLPLREENYLRGEPIDSLHTYAMTKRMLYEGLRALSRQFGLRYLCVVPSTVYGPGYHVDGRQMHFIFDLIRKILRAKNYGEPVVLWGHGNQKRELVFIDDFVRLLLRLDEGCEDDLVNLGAGEERTIRQFASVICDIVGYDPDRIEFDRSRYVGAESKCLEIEHLVAAIGDPAYIPLEDGLTRTIEYFSRMKVVAGLR